MDKEAATFTGHENIDVGQTSDWAERAWCNKCGSGLWYRVTSPDSVFANQYQIPLGLFDDAEGIKLDRETFYDCKSSAFNFGDDTKKMTEAEVWSSFANPEGETNDQV